MDRTWMVLPICKDGTLSNVDSFMEEEELQGSAFVSPDDAEIFLLKMKEKYRSSKTYENFAVFANISHAIPNPAGYTVVDTVFKN